MWSLHNLNGNFAADPVEICEVWDSNLEDEVFLIRSIIADYPFVAVDTKFPGVVVIPVVSSPTPFMVFNYQTLQLSVNDLKLLQLGLTFFNSSGHLPHFGSPPRPRIWQFNFREFDAARDICDRSAIEHLSRSGMDFEKNHRFGVTAVRFSQLMISSGIVRNNSVHWISFHACIDLGYILKTLICRNIPDTREAFYRFLLLYFPKFYEIKYLLRIGSNLIGTLQKVAEDLGVRRAGTYHLAGSDSLLVAAVFRMVKDRFFLGSVERYAGVLIGLNVRSP